MRKFTTPSSPDHAQRLAKDFNDELLRLRHAEFRTQQLQDRAHFASILAGERQRADEAAAQDQAAIRLLLERVAELEAATRCQPASVAMSAPVSATPPRQGVPSAVPNYSGSGRSTDSNASQSETRSSLSRPSTNSTNSTNSANSTGSADSGDSQNS